MYSRTKSFSGPDVGFRDESPVACNPWIRRVAMVEGIGLDIGSNTVATCPTLYGTEVILVPKLGMSLSDRIQSSVGFLGPSWAQLLVS